MEAHARGITPIILGNGNAKQWVGFLSKTLRVADECFKRIVLRYEKSSASVPALASFACSNLRIQSVRRA
jgi:hypothetical protein